MAVFVAPAFLIGVIAWLGDRLTSRAFKLTAAIFYVTSLVAVIGGIFALLGGIGAFVPGPAAQAMSVAAPSDWAAMSGIVIACKTTELIYSIFFRAYRLALNG